METKELTNDLIAEKLTRGLVYRGVATDANDCVTLGIWDIPSSTINVPANCFRSTLVCLPYLRVGNELLTVTQYLMDNTQNSPKLYRRMMYEKVWYGWELLF